MLIGWLYTPSGCMLPGSRGGSTRGVSAERFETPLVGGAARLWRRGGNPPAPAFPRRGKRERGRSNFLAAAGICSRVTPGCRPLAPYPRKPLWPLKSRNSLDWTEVEKIIKNDLYVGEEVAIVASHTLWNACELKK